MILNQRLDTISDRRTVCSSVSGIANNNNLCGYKQREVHKTKDNYYVRSCTQTEGYKNQ